MQNFLHILYFDKKNYKSLEQLILSSGRHERREVLSSLENRFGRDEVSNVIENSFECVGLKKSLAIVGGR